MTTIILLDETSRSSSIQDLLITKLRDTKEKEKIIWEIVENLVDLYLGFHSSGNLAYLKMRIAFEEEYQVGFRYYLTVSIPDVIKNSRFIVDKILTQGKHSNKLIYANALNLWRDRRFVMEILKEFPEEFPKISEELKSDKEILKIVWGYFRNHY